MWYCQTRWAKPSILRGVCKLWAAPSHFISKQPPTIDHQDVSLSSSLILKTAVQVTVARSKSQKLRDTSKLKIKWIKAQRWPLSSSRIWKWRNNPFNYNYQAIKINQSWGFHAFCLTGNLSTLICSQRTPTYHKPPWPVVCVFSYEGDPFHIAPEGERHHQRRGHRSA